MLSEDSRDSLIEIDNIVGDLNIDSEYMSCIDYIDENTCRGWVSIDGNPSDFSVTARISDWEIGSSKINIYRDDVRVAGYNCGIAGFDIIFNFPISASILHLVIIEARRNSDNSVAWAIRAPDVEADSEMLDHIEKLRNFVDMDYYSNNYGSDLYGLSPEFHYYFVGRFEGKKPNIIFDPHYYVKYSNVFYNRNVDIHDALNDYIDAGESLGIRPSALFDPSYIFSKHPEAIAKGALQYYLFHGEKDKVETSLLFWPEWYGKEYSIYDNMLYHFLEYGIKNGNKPNPIFDTNHVRFQFQCEMSEVISIYSLSSNQMNAVVCDLIDNKHVISQDKFREIGSFGLSIIEFYIKNHRYISPNKLFDNEFFVNNGSYGGSGRTLLSDYLAQSTSDLRPHPLFWDSSYRNARPDVANAGVAPLAHYFAGGHQEYVRTHPLIDHNFLIEHTAGRQLDTPLEYYQRNYLESPIAPDSSGPVESYINRNANPVAYKVGKHPSASPFAGAVGLFAHVYYVDLIPEVADVANNLPNGTKLFISTDTTLKAASIKAQMQELCDHRLEVRVLPNRGRDIAPFLIGFADRLREVEYGIHIHTKKSPHYSSAFSKWRRYLYGELAGSKSIVMGHLTALQDPRIGMSAPVDFPPLVPLLNWGGNRQRAERLIGAMGGKLPSGFSPELPSGSMLWFKTAALAPFLDLNLSLAHFDPEAGQVDGTFAHVIERCLFHICELSGHQFVRTTTQSYIEGTRLTDSLEEAMNRTLPSAWRKDGILEQYHPETTKFIAKGIKGGPRLNLLIPTADTSVGYAGVSEAIRLFTGALAHLGEEWSGRIIMTDVPPSNMFTPPAGFRLASSFDDAENARKVIVSGCDRNREFLTLREQDVFVASAWWNAGQAFDLIRQACQIYGGASRRKLLYLVQDDERGFNPWSTKFKLCDDTYNRSEETFAVFNTPLLAQHFRDHSLSTSSFTYEPPINASLTPGQITPFDDRENWVLLYARPHAVRNGLDFIDAVVGTCLKDDPDFWGDWKWLAIGEDFDGRMLKSADHITVRGRLTLEEYREVLTKSKLGISLMVSPHPSYPPLEMAAHGVRVIANRFEDRDLNALHSGITSFGDFDPLAVSTLLKRVATDRTIQSKAKVDWFFNEKTNASAVFSAMADAARGQFATGARNG